MAAGDVKIAYAASSNLTVTNLASIATSATWIGGWTSAEIDNTTNLYDDYHLSGIIKVASAGLAAGEIRVYLYGHLDDSNYPDVFSAGTEGTEGTATIHDVEVRDTAFRLAKVMATNTTASRIYPFGPLSAARLFGGVCPAKFSIFVTQSTTANLESSGHQVTTKGIYHTVAQ
jgi:hypothetical protein